MSVIKTGTGRKKSAPHPRPGAEPGAGKPGSQSELSAPARNQQEESEAAGNSESHGANSLERTLEALSVDHETALRIRRLPQDIGWLLVTAGAVGVVMPGVLGLPFLVLGGLVLLPATNQRAERWLTGHAPTVFKGSIRQINRFLDDLERRYPRVPNK